MDLPAREVKGALSLGVNGQPVRTIAPQDTKKRIDSSGTGLLVLDVRDPDEYVGELGHISGSLLTNTEHLAQRLDELEPYREREIVTVCKGGGRSHTAAGILMQAGYASVVSIAGGMTGWNEAGYTVTRETATPDASR